MHTHIHTHTYTHAVNAPGTYVYMHWLAYHLITPATITNKPTHCFICQIILTEEFYYECLLCA